jgi:hypothetical protein
LFSGSLSCRPARLLRRQTGRDTQPTCSKGMSAEWRRRPQGVVDNLLLDTLLCRALRENPTKESAESAAERLSTLCSPACMGCLRLAICLAHVSSQTDPCASTWIVGRLTASPPPARYREGRGCCGSKFAGDLEKAMMRNDKSLLDQGGGRVLVPKAPTVWTQKRRRKTTCSRGG